MAGSTSPTTAPGLTVAVRDFWQLYPKGFRVNQDGLFVDLCPDFPGRHLRRLQQVGRDQAVLLPDGRQVQSGPRRAEAARDHARTSTAPRRRVSPTRSAGLGETDVHADIARAFQEPLIAVCPPERYCDTRVFGEILPATAGRSAEYEAVCEQVYESYVRHREASHEYGMLNFGDQWGERRVNWANGEYDHHHAFLMQFIRTADRKWYFLGEKAARHAIDVDTCHHGPHRGGEWIHSMGHTGGYFREPV